MDMEKMMKEIKTLGLDEEKEKELIEKIDEIEKEEMDFSELDCEEIAEIICSLNWAYDLTETVNADIISDELRKELLKKGIRYIPEYTLENLKYEEKTVHDYRLTIEDILYEELVAMYDWDLTCQIKTLNEIIGSETVYRLHEDGKYDIFEWRTIRIEKTEYVNRYFLTLETATNYVALCEI